MSSFEVQDGLIQTVPSEIRLRRISHDKFRDYDSTSNRRLYSDSPKSELHLWMSVKSACLYGTLNKTNNYKRALDNKLIEETGALSQYAYLRDRSLQELGVTSTYIDYLVDIGMYENNSVSMGGLFYAPPGSGKTEFKNRFPGVSVDTDFIINLHPLVLDEVLTAGIVVLTNHMELIKPEHFALAFIPVFMDFKERVISKCDIDESTAFKWFMDITKSFSAMMSARNSLKMGETKKSLIIVIPSADEYLADLLSA